MRSHADVSFQATLRQIWSLSSVLKNKSLTKDEFMVFLGYVMLVQGSQATGPDVFATPTSTPELSFDTLKAYLSRPQVSLPKFENIQLPKPRPPSIFNPFQKPAEVLTTQQVDYDDFGDFNGGT